MMEGLIIIASIEQSTMASTWTEYLCLHRTSKGKWCIDIRCFEIVGPASDYINEEDKLPDQIGGQEVVGIQDDWVMVNNLVLHHSDAYPIYEFERFDEGEFNDIFRPENAECASEIVMLTWRTLQPSRAAMLSAFAVEFVITSLSHLRPRAIDATKVARVSERIGRTACGATDMGRRISRRRLESVLRHDTFSTLRPRDPLEPFDFVSVSWITN
jgi:hypothetical protein